MALNVPRLRRALSLSSTFLGCHRRLTTTTRSAAATISLSSVLQSLLPSSPRIPTILPAAIRCFHWTHLSLSSSRSFNDVDKIDPDEILFEGCDYKHWLIVMDFGKDPRQRPPPEEMIETYVQTLAKVVGSVEEAKKKMYACSTTTYTGFQAEIDEQTAKKFEDMPGVIFVLPDSYIDPVNKEYGGDKYINGTIIPRPPPVQYGRMRRGGRQNDQRPRGPMPNQHGNPAYNQHGSMPRDGRGYIPQRGFPQQPNFLPQQQNLPPNYGPPAQGERSNPVPNGPHYPAGGRDAYQGGGSNPYQANYNYGYNQPHQRNNHPGDHGGYAPQGKINNGPDHCNNHPQGLMSNHPGDSGGGAHQGQMGYPGDNRNYAPQSPAGRAYGQTGVGSFDESGAGYYGPGPSGTYAQGEATGYRPRSAPYGENQMFSRTTDEQSAEQHYVNRA